MPTPTEPWDENAPSGSTNYLDELDDYIRKTKVSVAERLINGGHYMSRAGTAVEDGRHKCGVQSAEYGTGVLAFAFDSSGNLAVEVRDSSATSPSRFTLGDGVGGSRKYKIYTDEVYSRLLDLTGLATLRGGVTAPGGVWNLASVASLVLPADGVNQSEIAGSAIANYRVDFDTTDREVAAASTVYTSELTFTTGPEAAGPVILLGSVLLAEFTTYQTPLVGWCAGVYTGGAPTSGVGTDLDFGTSVTTTPVPVTHFVVYSGLATNTRYRARMKISNTTVGGHFHVKHADLLAVELRRTVNVA